MKNIFPARLAAVMRVCPSISIRSSLPRPVSAPGLTLMAFALSKASTSLLTVAFSLDSATAQCLTDLSLVAVGGGGVDVAVAGGEGICDGLLGLLGGDLVDAEAEDRHLDAVVEGDCLHVVSFWSVGGCVDNSKASSAQPGVPDLLMHLLAEHPDGCVRSSLGCAEEVRDLC
jgi:hypothetical protein